MRERNRLAAQLEGLTKLQAEVADATGLIEMAEAEGEAAMVAEAIAALRAWPRRPSGSRSESLLSGEADGFDCYVEVNAGAGGTEAQDWAEMLARMYTRWAERHGCKVEVLESSEGEQAGIKSRHAAGQRRLRLWLAEDGGGGASPGAHLARSTPRRGGRPAFASVWVYPVVDDSIEIEIDPSDLKVDTFRASGAGGQHVNKTESAIRITHVPSGIIVACQTDRSQHRNRAKAMEMLRARMYEAELQRREAASAATEAAKTDIGWGHQIRSYVLAPYQMVKDLRTGVEKGNPEAVLDGSLDDFMAAALAARVGATRSEASANAQ